MPRTPRILVLEDRWRERTPIELPIEANETQMIAALRSDELLPGRYTVAFVSQGAWRREARRPGLIDPETVLEVRKDEWPGMLKELRDIQTWLLALSAHADGAWGAPKFVPPADEWAPDQLTALGRTLVRSAGSLSPEVGRELRRWPLEQRLSLVDAVPGTDRWTTTETRVLSVLLGLPRTLTPDTRKSVMRESLANWPTLVTLASCDALPKATGQKLRYCWGYLYELQHANALQESTALKKPIAGRLSDSDSTTTFDPSRPAMLLHRRFKEPQHLRALRQHEIELDYALRTLGELLPKVSKVLPKIAVASLCRAFHISKRHLFETFKISHHNLNLPAKLAFVCASVALLQRAAAYEPQLHQIFDKSDCDRFEPLSTLCPELYDYYLLLAEASLRHFASKGVA